MTDVCKVASFNVNSIKARLPNLLEWLKDAQPDIVALQETKCVDDQFPFLELKAAGYEAIAHGQKSYNGVAILAREMHLTEICRGLPGDDADDQARYMEADVAGVRFAAIYLPNGNPTDSPKFSYKLAWMERLERRAAELMALETPVVLAGDFNVIPQARDCHDPAAWEGDALFRPETRAAFRSICHLGYYDALRLDQPDVSAAWTFWDYQGGAFQIDSGIRIDHLLLSPIAADRLLKVEIDRDPRGRPKASDHTPIIAHLKCETAGALDPAV